MASGGSYVMKDGKPELVECTKAHPAGNGPRDAKGNRLDEAGRPVKKSKRTDTKASEVDHGA